MRHWLLLAMGCLSLHGTCSAAPASDYVAAQPAAGAAARAARAAVLPLGTDLGETVFERPREVFHSEATGGHKSYSVVLGDVAFSSPRLLGDKARQAGISCSTCHVNGTSNASFFIPELSSRHGNFDPTSSVFNPVTDDHTLNPLQIPSLRGAKRLAPYGHDGRFATLRDFVHHVIVDEFAGPEPTAATLDAIVDYIDDIDFVPNSRLVASGELRKPSAAEKRGARLFAKPFAHDPSLSCAGCHTPTQAFVDHQKHDVGSGGMYKTPTLVNADFNAPYFHDGRFDSFDEVVAYFDRTYRLGLSAQDRQDLIAYLLAVGDGDRAVTADDVQTRVKECTDFATALDSALPQHDAAAARLVLDTLDRELRELTEKFPDPKDMSVSGGREERARARSSLKALVLSLREVDAAVQEGHFDEAMAGLADYRQHMAQTVAVMEQAKPWSLFDRDLHDAHFKAVQSLFKAGGTS